MMGVRSQESGVRIETIAVHAGRSIDRSTGAVTPPIHLSTTFERSPEGEHPLHFSYSREENPNRNALEQCLAARQAGREPLASSSRLPRSPLPLPSPAPC